MTFKRWMALGAVASALAFAGCQDRSRTQEDLGTQGTGTQTEVPATGGSGTGTGDSTIPGGSENIGGTPQDDRPGTELGGSGQTGDTLNDTGGSGGAGTVHDQGTLDQGGTGGSGPVHDQGTGGSGTVVDPGTAGDVDQGILDERDLNRPESMDESRDLDRSGEEAR